MRSKPPALPDLDKEEDADFRRKLSPLIARVLPQDRRTGGDGSDANASQSLQGKAKKSSMLETRTSSKLEDRLNDTVVIPRNGPPDFRNSEVPQASSSELKEPRLSGIPGIRITGDLSEKERFSSTSSKGRLEAAAAQARVEAARGSKRRFEYLIPERVGRALAHDAAMQGKSATTLLLEILRTAGYPVIDEDLVDLRKMAKR